jgi:hypothetical protein
MDDRHFRQHSDYKPSGNKLIQSEAEKVQIAIASGDDPNQEVRVANVLIDTRGAAVSLKRGASVHIVVRPTAKNPTE